MNTIPRWEKFQLFYLESYYFYLKVWIVKILFKFCEDESTYSKPIDLFLTHQRTKLKCLGEFEKYRHLNSELQTEYDDLNAKIDEMLDRFDKENCYKKASIINRIKKNCIQKYKNYMDMNVRFC